MQQLLADDDALSPERMEVLRTWAQSLRAACDTISLSSKYGLTQITVTGRLKGSPREGRLLQLLSRKLAEEYRLLHTVELEGSSFTARFSQSPLYPPKP